MSIPPSRRGWCSGARWRRRHGGFAMVDLTLKESKHWHQHYAGNATYWEKWAEPMADQQEKVNQLLLNAAGVSEGSIVSDLAPAASESAVPAATRIGPRGAVTVTDIASEMVEGVKRR